MFSESNNNIWTFLIEVSAVLTKMVNPYKPNKKELIAVLTP